MNIFLLITFAPLLLAVALLGWMLRRKRSLRCALLGHRWTRWSEDARSEFCARCPVEREAP